MRKIRCAVPFAAAALLLLPALGTAQARQCGDNCAGCSCCSQTHEHGATPKAGRSRPTVPDYDAALEQRITGVVVSAFEIPGSTELLVTISTGENSFEVQVGPAAWMAGKGYTLSPGEGVEILGAVVGTEGNNRILARQIWKGGEEIRLRDQTGKPLWPTS
jgi:hypothetical protein